MGKIESMLKSEISRLAKRECRAIIEPLQSQIRKLSREVKSLSAEVNRLAKTSKKAGAARPAAAVELAAPESETAATRLSPGLIKKIRKRQTLTQQQLAALVGVSAAAVQSWEQGIARPTGKNRSALIALRQMAQPEVAKLLDAKGIASAKRRPRTDMPGTTKKATK